MLSFAAVAAACFALWALARGLPGRDAVPVITAARYLPLAVRNRWAYEGALAGIHIPRVETINGVPTYVLADIDFATGESRRAWYVTNDAAGYRLHRWETPGQICFTAGDCADYSVTFNPPLTLLPALPEVGQVYRTAGTVHADVFGRNASYPLSYVATAALRMIETVATPAGNFEALKIEYAIRIDGAIAGQSTAIDFGATEWLAEGRGIVRQSVPGGTATLVSSNLGRREDCLFNWAEQTYALGSSTTEISGSYTYRSYSFNWPDRRYIGVSAADNHVYLLQGKMSDLGPVTDWYKAAGCS